MTSLLILARAFHFGSGMILVGVVAFRWLILLPAFRGAADNTWQMFTPLFRRLNGLFIWSGITLILSGLALFWVVAAEMSDTSLIEVLNGETLGTMLFQTRFGYVFQWRFGFAVILGFMIWNLVRNQWQFRRKESLLEIGAGLLAIALLVSFTWTGHAAATGGTDFKWKIGADALHLFATAIWPTGLLPFALFLAYARRIKELSHFEPVFAVVWRFSTVSLITVAVLVITGLINSFFLVGSFEALVTTEYGRLLCLKLFLFILMLGIAAWNRFQLLPLLFQQKTASDKIVLLILQRLQGFVMTELGLGIAVIFVVAILGTTPPPQ